MITVGFCNLKGGVGKTTACINIAVGIAKKGKKVAVIDMDPQSNLSAGFGVTPSSQDPQVFDLLTGEASWDDIVQNKEGVDIIPSSLNLVMAELNTQGALSSDSVLRKTLEKIDPDRYDYILLDSPPQLGIFTRNVLAACNKIIVPMDGGFYSLFGLRLLDGSLDILSERLGNRVEIAGILMTNYNPRLYISRKIYEEVQKNFGDVVFENYVSPTVKFVEASSVGVSIFKYDPKSKGAEGYESIAKEFLKRIKTSDVQTKKPEPIIEVKTEILPEQKTEEKPEQKTEPEPESIKVPDEIPEPENYKPELAGEYEESIKRDVIEMLPESEKKLWSEMLKPITDISRGEIDVHVLREDFENSDKNRYTFYILNDEEDTLWPVMYQDQIIEPLKCVIKWDEHGAAEVFM